MNLSRLTESLAARLVRKFLADQAPNWAVIIAWSALFSFFPMILVMAAAIGFVLGFVGVESARVYTLVLSIIPSDNAARTQALDALKTFHEKSGIFFLVGFAGLIWSGAALFNAMQSAFAVVYQTRPRDFLRQVLISIAMVVLFTVLAGVSLVTSSLLSVVQSLPFIPGFLNNPAAALALQLLLGVAAGCLLFGAIYYVVPNRRQELRKVWPGSLVAGVLFELLTLLFPLYLRLTGSSNTYGKTFGLVFLFMTFAYFFGLITMLGVELNSVLYPVQVGRPSAAPAAPSAPPRERARPLIPKRRRSRLRALIGLIGVGALGLLGRRRRRVA